MVDAMLDSVQVNHLIVEEGLRSACKTGHVEQVQSILSACTEEEKDQLLHNSSKSGPPIFDAIISEQVDIVKLLVDQGYKLEMEFDVHVPSPVTFSDEKCTALCLACINHDEMDIVKILLEKGADVNHSSQRASPLLYCVFFDSPERVTFLLDHGADLLGVPQGLSQSQHSVPVLYEACIKGYQDCFDVLLARSETLLNCEQKLCLLALLGARRIQLYQDYANGLKYWRQSLEELAILREGGFADEQNLPAQLQSLYRNKFMAIEMARNYLKNPFDRLTSSDTEIYEMSEKHIEEMTNGPEKHRASLFEGTQLATTLKDLDDLNGNTIQLNLQALLILDSFFGPTGSPTDEQVTSAVTDAMDNHNDLFHACKLLLYNIEALEKEHVPEIVADCALYLVNLLLNHYHRFPQDLSSKEVIMEILLAGLRFTGDCLITLNTAWCLGLNLREFQGQEFAESKTRLKRRMKRDLVGVMETFMGFLQILVAETPSSEQLKVVYSTVIRVVKCSSDYKASCFHLQSKMLHTAVCGGGKFTFGSKKLFPSSKVFNVLMASGQSINWQDNHGKTALHYNLECPTPNPDIVNFLLVAGAHIDTMNCHGVTPYDLIQKKFPHLQPSQYLTLKCFCARLIMNLKIPYEGQIPTSLEDFVAWHGMPIITNRDKKSLSTGDFRNVIGN